MHHCARIEFPGCCCWCSQPVFGMVLEAPPGAFTADAEARNTVTDEPDSQTLRLRKKHTPAQITIASAADGARLRNAQSLRLALMASLIAIVLFSAFWALLSAALGRVFPWLPIVLGLIVGLVVRRAGRGLDWRFPVLAAVMTCIGALAGNIVVSAAFTAQEFDTGTLHVLRAVTSMTWPVYFSEVMSGVDVIYAATGAAIAAYYAKRPLSRAQYLGLRKYQAGRDKGR